MIYTNYAKTIYDQLKSLIVAEIPAFTKPRKVIFRDRPLVNDFGYEDHIRIALISDNFESHQTTGGTDIYALALHYYRKMDKEINYNLVTDMGEHLWKLFSENRSQTTYWHNVRVVSVVYVPPPFPEVVEKAVDPFQNWYGFTMELDIAKGKYT